MDQVEGAVSTILIKKLGLVLERCGREVPVNMDIQTHNNKNSQHIPRQLGRVFLGIIRDGLKQHSEGALDASG